MLFKKSSIASKYIYNQSFVIGSQTRTYRKPLIWIHNDSAFLYRQQDDTTEMYYPTDTLKTPTPKVSADMTATAVTNTLHLPTRIYK